MKTLLAILLFFSCSSLAKDAKPNESESKDIKAIEASKKDSKSAALIRKDLDQLCDSFKEADQLKTSKEYMDKPTQLKQRLEKSIDSSVKTVSVKNAWSNFKLVDPSDKEGFWIQISEDLGVDAWHCPFINLYYKEDASQ